MLMLNGVVIADDPRTDSAREVERLLVLFNEAIRNEQFDEAETLAKRIVEESIDAGGRESLAAANALTILGHVQHELERYLPALQNFRAAIETIERVNGGLSGELVRPLQGLGETELALGEYARAEATFERAIHITHVNEGPLNLSQIESMNSISEIHRRRGHLDDALDVQKKVLSIQTRNYGEESVELLPGLQNHAEWMRRLRLPNRERNTYSRILDIQEDNFGKRDLRLVPTLVALGVTVRDYKFDMSGEIGSEFGAIVDEGTDDRYVARSVKPDFYLRRAMEIVAEHPESDWRQHVETSLQIGDYYSIVRRLVRARLAYNDAWDVLSSSADRLHLRRAELEWPRMLTRLYLPEYFEDGKPVFDPENTDGFERASISVTYDVSKLGKTVNVNVVESSGPGLTEIEEFLIDALEDQVNRPRMEGREIVDTYGLSFRYSFFYRTSAK